MVDRELDELFGQLPAIALEGAKGVGKTATASQRAKTVFALDDPVEQELTRADPERVLGGEKPVLIDEWQRMPSTFDRVRRAVDAGAAGGSYLMAGSALPEEEAAPTHSGAGRIESIRMRPMTLMERGVTAPTVSLGQLLRGAVPGLHGRTAFTVNEYIDEILASGFPGARGLTGRPLRVRLDGYLTRIVTRDIEEQGTEVRRPDALRRWLAAYAAATSTTTSFEAIRDAATAGQSDKPAKTTVGPYRDVLEQLFVVDPVPAWVPTFNRLRRLASPPKHQLVDPALAARLLGVDASALRRGQAPGPRIRRDETLLGALFEALVTLDVRVYAQAAEARVGHLRTWQGEHEVDLIVERGDGGIVAIEVKVARVVDDKDVKHLRWLRERLGDAMLDGIVVSTGPEAYRRQDGIGVVPAALLGP